MLIMTYSSFILIYKYVLLFYKYIYKDESPTQSISNILKSSSALTADLQ